MKDLVLASIIALLVLVLLSVGGCGYLHWGHGCHNHDCTASHCRGR